MADAIPELIQDFRELQQEIKRLRAALNEAAYALFQIKRMVPDAIPQFASAAHEKACAVLDDEK